jgi:hypothetical protein
MVVLRRFCHQFDSLANAFAYESATGRQADMRSCGCDVGFVPILLQKSVEGFREQ